MKILRNRPFLLLLAIWTCFTGIVSSNLHAAAMDEKAKVIADKTVEAMGGRESYNNTRYISWVFFGRNFHVWDKYTGDVRIEANDGHLVLMNIHSKKGKVWKDGVALTDLALIEEKLEWGYRTWVNDSYWLVMPYKLHDDGVVLSYSREDKTAEGKLADVLTMTFEGVGVTPDNKYELFVEKDSNMITQWKYYPKAEQEEARFTIPWKNWQYYGDIMLSDDRGQMSLRPVKVYQDLPEEVMRSPLPTKDIPGAFLQ
ncbi:hypothetical protein [Agaribacter flavus]|uniref:Outer membrane lipoprotein-sorting protein n=1 Tax=Agaribacter flavus TaxID=1902781 RepID=A0ABV7FQ39_9ALTE